MPCVLLARQPLSSHRRDTGCDPRPRNEVAEVGLLFGSRFFSVIVQRDAHLIQAIRLCPSEPCASGSGRSRRPLALVELPSHDRFPTMPGVPGSKRSARARRSAPGCCVSTFARSHQRRSTGQTRRVRPRGVNSRATCWRCREGRQGLTPSAAAAKRRRRSFDLLRLFPLPPQPVPPTRCGACSNYEEEPCAFASFETHLPNALRLL